jgi:hypothetical protein
MGVLADLGSRRSALASRFDRDRNADVEQVNVRKEPLPVLDSELEAEKGRRSDLEAKE